MSATRYTAGTKVVYYDENDDDFIEDVILIVREGYYQMPSDDYVDDEAIVAAIVNGKYEINSAYIKGKKAQIAAIFEEIERFEEWAKDKNLLDKK